MVFRTVAADSCSRNEAVAKAGDGGRYSGQ